MKESQSNPRQIIEKLGRGITIGSVEIKNRMAMQAVHMGYADTEGFCTERLLRYYEERARGGVGLIVVGIAYVDTAGKVPLANPIAIYDDKFVPGLKALTDAVHKHGAKVFLQLGHAGGETSSKFTGVQPVAPSSYTGLLGRELSRDLTVPEIKGVVGAFGNAALRAKRAGFDGVEIHCIEDFLVHEFLSPHINKRTDTYGGSLENRIRFLSEIVQNVREKTGAGFAISIRLTVDELVPGKGRQTLEEWKEVAKRLDGTVDLLSIVQGCNESRVPQIYMSVPRGAFVYLARQIKEIVSKTPVAASTRINAPLLAEEVIAEGKADIVNLGRPLIADPEFPGKALAGKIDEIRKCIACNQGCIDEVLGGRSVTCLVNPMAGREAELEISPARAGKKVMVIGAGPAGMECAMVAALRGHSVTVYDRNSMVGGQLNQVAIVPGRSEFSELVKFLSVQMKKLKIKVNLKTEVTPELIKREKPDVVVAALGSNPIIPRIPGIDRANVILARDVLSMKKNVGKHVIIIGAGGVGCDTAIYLAHMGAMSAEEAFFLLAHNVLDAKQALSLSYRGTKKVTLVEMLPRIGTDIGRTTRWIITDLLSRYGVKTITGAKVVEITDHGAILENAEGKHLVQADSVVLACGSLPASELFEKIRQAAPEVYSIGDCVQPRKALDALKEGMELGLRI